MNQQDALEQDAKAFGERLALLLASAKLPDEVKQGFADMIPHMNETQLDQLASLLEQAVEGTQPEDITLLDEKVQAAQAHYQSERTQAHNQAKSRIQNIQSMLKKMDT